MDRIKALGLDPNLRSSAKSAFDACEVGPQQTEKRLTANYMDSLGQAWVCLPGLTCS